jgi:hypothetical protein
MAAIQAERTGKYTAIAARHAATTVAHAPRDISGRTDAVSCSKPLFKGALRNPGIEGKAALDDWLLMAIKNKTP